MNTPTEADLRAMIERLEPLMPVQTGRQWTDAIRDFVKAGLSEAEATCLLVIAQTDLPCASTANELLESMRSMTSTCPKVYVQMAAILAVAPDEVWNY